MQIGADIYCDTALIARTIEALHPQPAILPPAFAGHIALIEDWADHRLFMHAVPPTLVGLLAALPPGFLDDRAAMTPAFTEKAVVGAAPHALASVRHALDFLDVQLAASPFLCGSSFTLADAACFHPVNFMLNNPELGVEMKSRRALAAWHRSIVEFGPGDVTVMSGAAALDLARDAEPVDVDGSSVTGAGYAPGDTVTIVADDYGQETTSGTVIRVLQNEVTVNRTDAAVGTVAVHYPRAGYRVTKSG
jgi:glutathione S-transferase